MKIESSDGNVAEKQVKEQDELYAELKDSYNRLNQDAISDTLALNVANKTIITLRTQLEQAEKAARETLAKTMIALDLSTGHGDAVEDLCAELRSQWEELRTKVKFYEKPIDGLRLEYDPLRPHLARLIDSGGNWEWVSQSVIGLWATLQKQNENLFKMRATP